MSLLISVTDDLDACLTLRFEVFVDEQGVPVEEERDALDDTATHILATLDGTPVGTARVVFQDDVAKIGRVCVVKPGRGTGLGAKLIEACVAEASLARCVANGACGMERRGAAQDTHMTT